jgi:hypothetical protein
MRNGRIESVPESGGMGKFFYLLILKLEKGVKEAGYG